MSKNPILIDCPYRFETERLTIRGPLPGDGAALHQVVAEAQAHLKSWMPWAVDLLDAEGYEVRVREGRLKFLAREDLWMMIMLKESNMIIGGTGLHRIDWQVPKFEMGYWIHPSYQGKGYVSEAGMGLTEFAFTYFNAKRIEIQCDEKNVRSAAVAQRLGFTHEATIRNDARHHLTNELRHTMIFAKTQPD